MRKDIEDRSFSLYNRDASGGSRDEDQRTLEEGAFG